MIRNITKQELDIAYFFIKNSGHDLTEWEECDHLWEYTVTCKDCGNRFGVLVSLENKFASHFIENKHRMRKLGIWLAPEDPKTHNTQLATIAMPMEQPILTCTEMMIREVIT